MCEDTMKFVPIGLRRTQIMIILMLAALVFYTRQSFACECPGVIYSDTSCFWASLEEVTQSQANQSCISAGGHLATFKDIVENDFVQANLLLPLGKEGPYWIGVIQFQGVWITDFGPVEWTNWASFKSTDCCRMRYYDGMWITDRCTVKAPYVCKAGCYDPTTTPQTTVAIDSETISQTTAGSSTAQQTTVATDSETTVQMTTGPETTPKTTTVTDSETTPHMTTYSETTPQTTVATDSETTVQMTTGPETTSNTTSATDSETIPQMITDPETTPQTTIGRASETTTQTNTGVSNVTTKPIFGSSKRIIVPVPRNICRRKSTSQVELNKIRYNETELYRRKFYSAHDSRVSAYIVGGTFLFCWFIIFLVFLLPDVRPMFRMLVYGEPN